MTNFKWPKRCAVCARYGTHTLESAYSATADAKYVGVYASWRELPVFVRFPVCRFHWGIYYLPMKLTGMSMWHKVVIAAAVLAFVGGALGIVRLALGFEPFTEAPVRIYVACLAPLAAWWVAGRAVPVRVSDFAPPRLWLRIRSTSFAEEFQRLNPTITASSS